MYEIFLVLNNWIIIYFNACLFITIAIIYISLKYSHYILPLYYNNDFDFGKISISINENE